jgi:hypothetical protein
MRHQNALVLPSAVPTHGFFDLKGEAGERDGVGGGVILSAAKKKDYSGRFFVA